MDHHFSALIITIFIQRYVQGLGVYPHMQLPGEKEDKKNWEMKSAISYPFKQ